MSPPDRIHAVAAAPRATTLTVRASSWGSLFDCAHRWEGEHLLDLRSASGLRATLGTAIHAGTAAFDAGRLPGHTPVTPDEAAGVFLDALHNPDGEVDYRGDDLSVPEAERVGLALTTSYCYDVAPRFHFTSVEARLQPLAIDCGSGVVIRLTGSMDRARTLDAFDEDVLAGDVIADIKSGSRVIVDGEASIRGRSAQLGAYQLMHEHGTGRATAGGQIIALPTKGRPEARVSPIWDARARMVGTDGGPGLIEHAAAMFRTGLFPPNPQSVLCSQKFCARWSRCNFHE